jgi:UDP:flavonoid glycosyltransferase YjiC (YdhE family)
MRVLVSTTAGSGHFGPLVPFARACAAAGHEVVVAAPASFAAEVAAAGFEHRPFANAPAELLGQIFQRVPTLTFDESNRVVLADVFGRLDAQAAFPGLAGTIADWRPDLVLREPAEFGSLVAARSAGVPQATVSISMTAMVEYLVPIVAEPLAELDALAGLPAGATSAAMLSSPTLTCVPAVLDGARPGGLAAAGPVHRFRDDSLASGHGPLPPAWGDPVDPLVYVTFGSVAARLGGFGGLYRAVVEALAEVPVRALLTTGHGLDPAELGPLPPHLHVEQWWPQADVLPHAAAVVGHGGFGTTMAALAAGVPQVVIPLFSYDQRINAEHVAAVGAGLHLPDGPASVAALPEAVDRLLADASYRDAARVVGQEMTALPPMTDAVETLQQIAAS